MGEDRRWRDNQICYLLAVVVIKNNLIGVYRIAQYDIFKALLISGAFIDHQLFLIMTVLQRSNR
jgi:hypothetical protein